MKKIVLPIAAVLFSVSLLAGCANGNDMRSQNYDGARNPNILTRNQDNFRPLATTTPENTNTTPGTQFNDVASGEWFAQNVQWASSLGLVDGYPDGSFQPNRPLTRAEVIKIIKSLADAGYITIPSGGTPTPTATPIATPTATPVTTPTATPTVTPTTTPTATPETTVTPTATPTSTP